MKMILHTIAVAFSMFSAVPAPHLEWTPENMRWMLAALPLVGALCGLACWGWAALCAFLALPAVLRGAGLCLLPVLLTGGVHLDGYADTCDALASHASPQRRQEILKDPHLGAFAAIRLCCYFLASFALWTALPRYESPAFLLSFCLSRALSGLAIAAFPLARNSGVFLFYRSMARNAFGGISGDLAGWFLQTAELWMLAAACAAQYLEPFLRRLS